MRPWAGLSTLRVLGINNFLFCSSMLELFCWRFLDASLSWSDRLVQNCQLLHRAGVFCVGEARVLYPLVILGITE